MSHTTRATVLAALLGLALSGPAAPFRLLDGLQAWLATFWAEGSIMDPDGLHADEGGIMDPDGLHSDAGGIMDPNG